MINDSRRRGPPACRWRVPPRTYVKFADRWHTSLMGDARFSVPGTCSGGQFWIESLLAALGTISMGRRSGMRRHLEARHPASMVGE